MSRSPLRIAVVGKGGAGKSVIAGTIARLLARRGHRVLALDSDLMPGLAFSLGAEAPSEPPLNDAAERDEDGRWRLCKGIGAFRAVARYSTEAPDGVRLLQLGKVAGSEGRAPIMPAMQAFYVVIHRLRRAEPLREWTLVGDLPAGPRQTAFDWAPYADTLLLVAEPTWKSALTARRIARIARARRDPPAIVVVANKVTGAADRARVARMLGEPVATAVPADDAAATADRLGLALIDHAPSSPAARAIERLVDGLLESTLGDVRGA